MIITQVCSNDKRKKVTKTNFYDVLNRGGKWLGAVRSYMQSRFRNGDQVTWGSQQILEGAPLVVKDVEEIGARAVAAYINESEETIDSIVRQLKNIVIVGHRNDSIAFDISRVIDRLEKLKLQK